MKKLKLVNKLQPIIFFILQLLTIALIFISDYYTKHNMGYYRIMHRLNREFEDNFYLISTIYVITMLIIALILKQKHGFKQKQNILSVLLILLNIVSFVFLPDYLNKTIVTTLVYLFITINFIFAYTLRNAKHVNILNCIELIIIIYIIFIIY